MGRTLSILGSTGSIGRQTLEVAEAGGHKVAALTFGCNVKLAEEQARRFRPGLIATPDEAAAADLRARLADAGVKVLAGEEGLAEAAALPEADTVVGAIVGVAGLKPTLAAIDAGKERLALANKETLVCAGELVMARAKERGVDIVPVDSEHSAIFQCLRGAAPKEVKKLLLTASGGPFYGKDRQALSLVTRADALKHPTWSMGQKITIDSATLMNKGFEVIEAMRLFGVPAERIEVAVHREGVVHSLVEFTDGAVLAQLGSPDMRLPIQYALTWPERTEGIAKPLDLFSCPPLTFRRPDIGTFRCLGLALECARTGGTSTAALNGANEAAVALFLEEKIGFLDIPRLVEGALERVGTVQEPSLDDIFEADRAARRAVLDMAR